jgi:hypothetical protein
MYYNPFSDEPVLICRNAAAAAAVVNRKEGVREEVGEGTGGRAAPMIAGEEKNMMGAQQAGRQRDRQEPACRLQPAPSVGSARSLITRQIIR